MALFKKKEVKKKKTGKASPVILDILNSCIPEEVGAVLLWPELMTLSKGTFAAVDDESVAFANPSGIKASLLDPSLPISVTFMHLGRVFSFISWFVLFTPGGTDPDTGENKQAWLVLKIPNRMAASDSRTAARIKVLPEAFFKILMINGESEPIPVTASEICFTGITLSVDGKDPDLKEGNKVVLQMGMEEVEDEEVERDDEGHAIHKEKDPAKETVRIWKSFKIEAEVRMKEPGEYGLFFPVCLTADGIKPPAQLRQLVQDVERVYLRRRAELDNDD